MLTSGDHRPLGEPRLSVTTSARSGLVKRIGEVRKWNEDPPHAAFGCWRAQRWNIGIDGSPDYPDELLAELDWVVASVHTSFGIPDAGDDRARDRRDRL